MISASFCPQVPTGAFTGKRRLATRWLWGALVAALVCSSLVVPRGDVCAQQVFVNNLQFATGVATDRAGNVYVDSDATFTTYISKYSANARLIGRTQLGGFAGGNLGNIARVPGSDTMLLLTNQGMIYIFGPDLRLSSFLNLKPLSFQTATNVYDLTTGRFVPFGLGSLSFGDIAAFYARSDLLYLYITAITSRIPVVLRLELNLSTNQVTWRAIAKTSGSSLTSVGLPGGIAVNGAGWVLTSFPFRGFFDTLAAFRTSFPATATPDTRPRYVLRTNRTTSGFWDMPSVGMTADAAGNFYVATGVVGTSLCGTGGSSALVLIGANPNVPNPRCFNLPSVLARTRDVAVSPVGNIPYLTAGSQVIRYGRLAAASPAAAAAPTQDLSADVRSLLALSGAELLQAH